MKKIIIGLIILILLIAAGILGYNQYAAHQELTVEKKKLELEQAKSVKNQLETKSAAEKAKEKIRKMKETKSKKDDSDEDDTTESVTTEQPQSDSTESSTSTEEAEQEQTGDAPTQYTLDESQPSATRTECVPTVMSDTGCHYVTPEEYGPIMAELEAANRAIQAEQEQTNDSESVGEE